MLRCVGAKLLLHAVLLHSAYVYSMRVYIRIVIDVYICALNLHSLSRLRGICSK